MITKANKGGLIIRRANPKAKKGTSVRVGSKWLSNYLLSLGLKIGKYKALKFRDCIVGVPIPVPAPISDERSGEL